ncbi:histone-lysine N-methyltransferase SETMAR [Biomphalaria pfeifferi]|uniref:Histone-lysine N-methyltransferase SETMAR n=1 Tax=Biomphalaria pfeifferi TaxID=112525 RepID=A0AAD8BWZ8_BIOPF|nr:histone-lysine N-methyltransferase SETMAR [Biomphalaria pfeifferi]
MDEKNIAEIVLSYEHTQITGSINCDKSFKYSKTNIPGSDDIVDAFLEQYEGCTCEESCSLDSCVCLQYFGAAYTEDQTIKSSVLKESSQPVLECGMMCTCCRQLCNNRIVQKGIKKKLEVFKTESKGYGLRTLENIAVLHFVCEYAGEVINEEEAKHRMAATESANEDNYLIVVREYWKEQVLLTYVDPQKVGNIGRFINHSCDPNLVMVPVRINHSVPRLAMFASKDIIAGEELTFNYSGASRVSLPSKSCIESTKVLPHLFETTDSKVDIRQVKCKPCYCGSNLCKGFMPYDKDLI